MTYATGFNDLLRGNLRKSETGRAQEFFRVFHTEGRLFRQFSIAEGILLDSVASRTLRTMIALVLLTVVVCSVSEMLDDWDHTVQTGVDTESTLVLMALCVGAMIAFAKFVFQSRGDEAVSDVQAPLPTVRPRAVEGRAFFVVPIPLGSRVPLRI